MCSGQKAYGSIEGKAYGKEADEKGSRSWSLIRFKEIIMPRYEVVEGVTIFDEYREAGSVVEIDESSAAPLVESGNLKEFVEETPELNVPSQPEGEGVPPHIPETTPEADQPPQEQGSDSTPDPVPTPSETPSVPPAPEETPAPTPAPEPEKKGWVGNHSV